MKPLLVTYNNNNDADDDEDKREEKKNNSNKNRVKEEEEVGHYYEYDQKLHQQSQQSHLQYGGADANNENTAAAVDERYHHLYVLPVLLLEFLAIGLTRAVLPVLLLEYYGDHIYLVMGIADCIRGLLAFVACPMFGKLSDLIGRKICLFITVLGTCAPVCSLALFSWDYYPNSRSHTIMTSNHYDNNNHNNTTILLSNTTAAMIDIDIVGGGGEGIDEMDIMMTEQQQKELYHEHNHNLSPAAITTFIILLSLSGAFSSTFTLVFAYISDTVTQQQDRVSAYGLALATFGLSFTIGPMAGGYLAQPTLHQQQHDHENNKNYHYVFISSLLLTILDLLYIYFILPESIQQNNHHRHQHPHNTTTTSDNMTITSQRSTKTSTSLLQNMIPTNFSWQPMDTIRMITIDPFIRIVGQIAFLYYTALWAIISTLSIYAVKQFHFSPEQLGELMSAFGFCTMLAEAVLVRYLVPWLGEKTSMRIGLFAFMLQCIVLACATKPWHLFVCVFFSLFANLVYPSLSSLVSGNVAPECIGEALGAINGIKALTEGIGPLLFGVLMTLSDTYTPTSSFLPPGWPYFIAAAFAYGAYVCSQQIPEDANSSHYQEEYIHELEQKQRRRRNTTTTTTKKGGGGGGVVMSNLFPSFSRPLHDDHNNDNEEYDDLLTEE